MADGKLTEVTEQVAETMEDVADHIDDIAEATREIDTSAMFSFFAGLTVGTAIGFGIGYFLMEKRVTKKMEAKYDRLADEMMSEVKSYVKKKEASSAMAKAAVAPKPPAAQVVEELGYTDAEQKAIDEIADEEVRNVFTEGNSDIPWDYTEELKNRTKEKPYVIHSEEYHDNELQYEQTTYTYYEGDDVMVDIRDSVIEPVNEIVGLENLQRFGHGSGDVNTVYIRNDEFTIDIEIVKTPKSFAEEVHGIVEHSDDQRHRRERRFDDE